MKRFVGILVIIGVMSLVFYHGAMAEDKPKKVRIGYLSLVNGQLISKGLRYHEEEMGIPVEWYKFDSGRDVNTAMAAGSIDFGNIGLPPATVGIGSGLKYQGIFCANILGAVESMVARKGINSVKDLVGKTVVAPFGSTTHYLLMQALKDAGVDKSKVKILDMSPSEAVASFMRGDIDAAYIWEPSLNKIVEAGGKIILTSKEMGDRGYITWDVIVVQPEFASKYPDLVTKFVKSELRAIDFWNKNPEKAAGIVAKELGGISVEDAKRMMAGTEILTLDQQLSPRILGTSKKKGGFVEHIVDVGKFLLEQGRTRKAVSKEEAERFLHPEFLEVLKKNEK